LCIELEAERMVRVLHGGPGRRTRCTALTLLSFATVLSSACSAEPPATGPQDTPGPGSQLQSVTAAATADAARITRLAPSQLQVLSAEAVTWPDGSLGCPEEGMNYTQALVRGFRVRIKAGEQRYEYHAGANGKVFLCPAKRIAAPIHDRET
jgi:hypothetical protein